MLPPPPPPYTPSSTPARITSLAELPLPILFKIVSYTLDPRATPERWISDMEEEKVRRVWGLLIHIRRVCRSSWLVSTSILRTKYHPLFVSLIHPGFSSDAYPHDSHPSFFDNISGPSLPSGPASSSTSRSKSNISGARQPIGMVPNHSQVHGDSVYSRRSRETAVFDRWIAVRIGEELRRVESSLSEESGAEAEIFSRFQPAARIEDLLLIYIPPSLLIPHFSPGPGTGSTSPSATLPLPWNHLSVILTPGWAQLYIWAKPYGRSFSGNGRDLVLEVRRTTEGLEGIAKRLGEGLGRMGRGEVGWGGRVE